MKLSNILTVYVVILDAFWKGEAHGHRAEMA